MHQRQSGFFAGLTEGDSITCGEHATRGHRYPDVLARLLRERFPDETAPKIIDAGDPGERLLRRAGDRPSGVTRFIRDTLAKPGVRVVVFLEGGNDIDGRGGPAKPAAMIAAYRKIVRAAHYAAMARAAVQGIR